MVVGLLVHPLAYKGVNQWFFGGTILQLGECFFQKTRKKYDFKGISHHFNK
jgi:hypothetical protein